MFEIIKNWFGGERNGAKVRQRHVNSAIRQKPKPPKREPVVSNPAALKAAPADLRMNPKVPGRVEMVGRNMNVLIQNKYQREDSGTHETLRLVDDSIVETGEEAGIDPYNTGKFDRSKNWDKRHR